MLNVNAVYCCGEPDYETGQKLNVLCERTLKITFLKCSSVLYLLGQAVVLDHLLDEVLGLSVGVGAATYGMVFVQGQVLGFSIHRGGAAEDQIVDSMSLHHLGHEQDTWYSQRRVSTAVYSPHQLGAHTTAMTTHLQQVHGGDEVDFVVAQRMLHRLANGLQTSKVDDGGEGMLE